MVQEFTALLGSDSAATRKDAVVPVSETKVAWRKVKSIHLCVHRNNLIPLYIAQKDCSTMLPQVLQCYKHVDALGLVGTSNCMHSDKQSSSAQIMISAYRKQRAWFKTEEPRPRQQDNVQAVQDKLLPGKVTEYLYNLAWKLTS